MSPGPGVGSPFGLLGFSEIRRFIRRSHAIAMTATFVIVYALASMTVGGMLILAHVTGGSEVVVLWGNQLGTAPWNYPALLVVAPWGIVTLPFFATFAMVVVSIGVGIGMAVAILLVIALVRSRRSAAGAPATIGSVAGLTPAMIALVTLGACCSTTAAATAGVWVVAQVSGASSDALLLNNWYLGSFQIAVVWVALVAQEIVLRVYGGLLGLSSPTPSARPAPPALDRRSLAGAALRAGLVVGGVTWALAMLAEWTVVNPAGAAPAVWFRWVFEHQLLAFFAILVALFPSGIVSWFRSSGRAAVQAVRCCLGVGGGLLAIGVPPPLAGWGVEGFGNEVTALLGVPSAWGGVSPVFAPGLSLFFRWGFQYLLLGGFALAVAISPHRALAPIRWTLRPGVPAGSPGRAIPAEPPQGGDRIGLGSEAPVRRGAAPTATSPAASEAH